MPLGQTSIDPNRVIGTQRLIISRPGECWVRLGAAPDVVDLCLVFEDGTDPKAQRTLNVQGRGNHARIVFRNWNVPLGVATAEPALIGTSQSVEPLFFDAVLFMVGSTRVVDVQVMVGPRPAPVETPETARSAPPPPAGSPEQPPSATAGAGGAP